MITTAVGNYPKIGPRTRAPSLRNAIAQLETGRITLQELNRVEDEVTREVIEEQIQAGLDLVTDGQIRWDDGQTYIARKVKGFSINGLIRYFDTNTYYRQPIVEERLSWQGPITVADYTFATAHSSRPVKAVLTGPYTLARLSQDQHERDLRHVALDLAEVMNQEAQGLEGAGAPIIQFDEPAILRYPGDFPLFQDAMRRLTRGLKTKLALYLYFRDVSSLTPQLFGLPFQVFGLDFIMGRANLQLLKDFPREKELGAGVVDARNTRLESVEELVKTLQQLSHHVPLDRMYVNPNCGLDFLPRESAYKKLTRMVEGAKRAHEVLA